MSVSKKARRAARAVLDRWLERVEEAHNAVDTGDVHRLALTFVAEYDGASGDESKLSIAAFFEEREPI